MDQLKFGLLKKLLSFKAKGVKKKFTNFEWQQVNRVAVLFEEDRPEQIDLVNIFLEKLKQKGIDSSALGYMRKPQEKSLKSQMPVVALKDFSLGGRLRSETGTNFLQEKYQLLVNFSEGDYSVLNYIASQVNAQLKVTFSGKKEPAFYHLQFHRLKENKPVQCIEQLLNTLEKIKVHVEG